MKNECIDRVYLAPLLTGCLWPTFREYGMLWETNLFTTLCFYDNSFGKKTVMINDTEVETASLA